VKKELTESNPNGPEGPLVPFNQQGRPSPVPRALDPSSLPQAGEFQGAILDINDPFEAALGDLLFVYRTRRPTLMVNNDIFWTYNQSAKSLGMSSFGVPESLLHRMLGELAHINAMRSTGTLFDKDNEEAYGAYVETAFYANMLFAWVKNWYLKQ
jgi:hypothetical protein